MKVRAPLKFLQRNDSKVCKALDVEGDSKFFHRGQSAEQPSSQGWQPPTGSAAAGSSPASSLMVSFPQSGIEVNVGQSLTMSPAANLQGTHGAECKTTETVSQPQTGQQAQRDQLGADVVWRSQEMSSHRASTQGSSPGLGPLVRLPLAPQTLTA